MKVKLLALCAILSVASAMAQQQKYMLPIGSNVNSRPAKVSVIISSLDTWARMEDIFDFHPSMGRLEDIIKQRATLLAGRYVVPLGFEQGEFALNVQVTPGPFSQSIFQFQQFGNMWAVPPEVLEVKLRYGVGTGWKIQGITAVIMRLYKNGDVVKYYSTKDGVGGDSPCDIGSAQSAQAAGYASVLGPYGLPWLKENWWDTGEITIEAFNGWATFFNANGSPRDGELIAASSPPPAFLESLRAPQIPAPRIAKLTRIFGNATEIVVEGETNASVVVEFAETLGNWSTVTYTPLVLTSSGRRVFTHMSSSANGFYRLRVISSSSQ